MTRPADPIVRHFRQILMWPLQLMPMASADHQQVGPERAERVEVGCTEEFAALRQEVEQDLIARDHHRPPHALLAHGEFSRAIGAYDARARAEI